LVAHPKYRAVQGYGPSGKMRVSTKQWVRIVICWDNHPNTGVRFHGESRTAFLPDNEEGREILVKGLCFTIGT
jgi:hypothetical protein